MSWSGTRRGMARAFSRSWNACGRAVSAVSVSITSGASTAGTRGGASRSMRLSGIQQMTTCGRPSWTSVRSSPRNSSMASSIRCRGSTSSSFASARALIGRCRRSSNTSSEQYPTSGVKPGHAGHNPGRVSLLPLMGSWQLSSQARVASMSACAPSRPTLIVRGAPGAMRSAGPYSTTPKRGSRCRAPPANSSDGSVSRSAFTPQVPPDLRGSGRRPCRAKARRQGRRAFQSSAADRTGAAAAPRSTARRSGEDVLPHPHVP